MAAPEDETFFVVLDGQGREVGGGDLLTDQLKMSAASRIGGTIVDQNGVLVYPPAQMPVPTDAEPVDEGEDA